MSLPAKALLIASLSIATSACSREQGGSEHQADGPTTSQDWSSLKGFDRIQTAGPDNVVVTTGDSFAVKAEGDAKAIEQLDIKVQNDRLEIGRKSNSGIWGGNEGGRSVTVRVTMPALRSVKLTGSGDFTLDKAQGDAFDLSLTGAGDVRIDQAEVGRMKADITGAGSIKMAGSARDLNLSLTGAGDVDAQGFKTDKADVSILGAGDIEFASDGPVAIQIMGPGNVTVKGKAQCTIERLGPGEARCAP